MKKEKASVSIFMVFSIILVISLIMTLLESARVSASIWYAKKLSVVSLDNLFSEYNIDLWKKYDIALLEYINDEEIEDTLKRYSREYNEGNSNYKIEVEDLNVNTKSFIVDDNAKELVRQMRENVNLYFVDEVKEIFKDEDKKLVESSSSKGEIISENLESSYLFLKTNENFKNINKDIRKIEKLKEELVLNVEKLNIAKIKTSIKNIKKISLEFNKNFKVYEKELEKLKVKVSKKEQEDRESIDIEILSVEKDKLREYKKILDIENIRYKELINKKEIIRDLNNYLENILEDLVLFKLKKEKDEDLKNIQEEILENLAYFEFYVKEDIKDNKKERDLYDIKNFLEKNFINLVIPKDIELSNMKYINSDKLENLSSKDEKPTFDITDKAFTIKYIERKFSDFTNNLTNKLSYEKEYLISRGDSDRDSLYKTIEKLLVLRMGLNYSYILTNKEILNEAKVLANIIASSIGFSAIAGILELFIISLVVLSETLIDIKNLLVGNSVEILKNKESFKMNVSKLFEIKSILDKVKKEDTGGKYNYNFYLNLLLLVIEQSILNYRILELMSINLGFSSKNIDIKNLIYSLDINMSLKTKRVFPFLIVPFSNTEYKNKIKIRSSFSY